MADQGTKHKQIGCCPLTGVPGGGGVKRWFVQYVYWINSDLQVIIIAHRDAK